MPATPILFCSHVVELGGAEHVLLDLLAALDRDRFDPHLALPADGELGRQAAALDVPVHRIPIAGRTRLQKALAVVRAGRALRALAADLDCRVLVANSMIAGYAAVRAQHQRLRCAWHLHIVTRSRLARRALHGAAAVIAPAQVALDALAPLPAGVAVPNGVPDRFFDATGHGLRSQLGVGSTPLLGIVGRIDPLKGHDALLRALATIGTGSSNPAPHLIVAGSEMFAESQARLGGHAERLRRFCSEQGLDAQVHWLGQVDDTAPLLAQLDLLAVPSTIPECAPRTIAEAQAAGCAVIASGLGGIPEMIRDGETGLLVDPDAPDSLPAAIGRLLTSPDERSALARSARVHAEQSYRMATFARRCEAVFARLAREP